MYLRFKSGIKYFANLKQDELLPIPEKLFCQ